MALTMNNPAFNETVFDRPHDIETTPGTMTVRGTAIKTGWLLVILLCAAAVTWAMSLEMVAAAAGKAAHFRVLPTAMMLTIAGVIGALIFALITIFRPRSAPWSAPLYAGFEGLALGGISAWFETIYPGIVLQAVALTFGTLAVLLVLYIGGIVRATERFKAIIMAATGAILLVYIVSLVLRLFGVGVPYIHDAGPIGIGFSLFVVGIAALNLVLDFDFIEQGAKRGAPLYMEWYGGFGLLVTLVWLYLEILKLLSKLRSRD